MNVSAAYEAVLAEQSRASLHFFTRRMFKARKGFRWVNNWHHEAICRALVRVFKGECTRLIINVPPRYSKTEYLVNFMPWALGHWPDSEFIYTSYSATLAENNTAAAKGIVQSVEYQRIFPGVQLRADAQSKGDWRTTAGGIVYAAGSGGTITGFGAGKMRPGFGGAILIDDPHKADEATSDVMRKNVIDWFQNTVESRKNDPERTPIILIMQRLHEADLAGFLLGGGNGETWEHLCLDAIQGERTDNEAALWPAKHSLATLRQMERSSPYVFAGQYRQRPAPLAGGEFKPDAIGVIEALPAGTRFVRAWDLAGTESDGDWTAGGKLGEMPDGRYVIADLVHLRESPEQVEASVKATATRDGTGVPVSIPQDPGQAGKAQVRQFTRLLSGFTVKSKPVSGDKVTRARPFAAQVNVGNVVMLRGPWNDAVINEMRSFPNAKHDDTIDALALAFDELTTSNTGMLDYYRAEADEAKRLREEAAKPGPGHTVVDLTKPSSSPEAFMQ
jgi:predicted phage terminase large subunit-like protein